MSVFIEILILLAMTGSLLLIPLGLPGLWIAVALVLGLAVWGKLSWTFLVVSLLAAAVAEAGELAVVRAFGKRYGGSSRAFWGAVVGGMAGLFVGVPIPVVGSLVTAFLGSFLGAGLVTWLETRSLRRSGQVGWGIVLARTAAVALKVAVGAALVAATALALFL
jgi:uncharacterized protein YqgC (DUF456 family)